MTRWLTRSAASPVTALAVVLLMVGGTAVAAPQPRAPVAPVLDFTMKDIDGKSVRLSRYQGKVLLVVNVASLCGNTPQYASLEKLYRKYRSRGLVVLAFPANDFGQQEPGSNTEIKQFCTSKYHVTFPVFSKITVKGDEAAPLYKYLTGEETDPRFSGDIEWNFAKFVIDRKGEIVARFAPKTDPLSPEVVAVIERELASR